MKTKVSVKTGKIPEIEKTEREPLFFEVQEIMIILLKLLFDDLK
jgi:hypothetical protein